MPGSNKTERNRQLKANRDAGLGDEMGRIPARIKDAAITMTCLTCKSVLTCTKTNTELKRHAEGKHGKANYEECFPGAEVHRAALEKRVTKDRKEVKGDGLTKAQRRKKAEAGMDDLLSAGICAKAGKGKKKGR
eukprot:CAMPEP_0181109632 /NCGR_PEP_ID=MMETSP1071-20121207/18281_1 /TAXON_ID=35127 /ORGANISM="Thalassiosira sp., Strain NH16" /LENGTH=133 /DNA_ID=CAMNT_0023193343 /DNA_START=121 /DNA_END=522 /DNA_ORIENTATION=-